MANFNYGPNDGYPMVDIDSDNENVDSSDDDIDVILHGTPEQKRRLRRKSLGKESSSDDDFEKEMEAELNENIRKFHAMQNNAPGSDKDKPSKASGSSSNTAKSESKSTFYNDEYFDSDSEEEDPKAAPSKRKHPVVSNDDLLYDPDMDEDDQKWVDAQRRKYLNKSAPKKGSPKKVKPLPHSDAALNCPACMTLLCLDCQRHSVYNNQYRAMFVQNCVIDETERLKYPKEKAKKNKKKKKKTEESSMEHDAADEDCPPEDLYNPVRCSVCTTEVGVFDKDEVYHFFNVLSSYT